jgi:accessory gene regulator protein AgrB
MKYWAIIAMLTDHIAWTWFPDTQLPGQLMHLIGRTTAPIMCFFIAEGYHYTKNLKRYFLRLLVFAAISFIPFVLYEGSFMLPVIWTLACGLLAIVAWDKIGDVPLRILVEVGICVLAVPGDWMFFAVLMCLTFWIFRESRIKQSCALVGVTITIMLSILFFSPDTESQGILFVAKQNWYQLGIVLTIPMFFAYNGKTGKFDSKWLFYIFYPAHLLALFVLRLWVFP